jgi:hypothetical protein
MGRMAGSRMLGSLLLMRSFELELSRGRACFSVVKGWRD